MFCVNCGTKIEDGIKICPTCGNAVSSVPNEPVAPIVQQQSTPLPPRPMADEIYCHSCGSVIKKIAEICPKCGVKQNNAPYSQNALAGKNNIVFLVFTILFTVVGIFLNILSFYFWLEGEEESYGFIFATIAFSIGILFSIISLYRKPNKLYFWFCISPCILLLVWGVLYLVTMDF
jgi:RNA polymerase subunit RPABC4/transcription elongation factor Spt4